MTVLFRDIKNPELSSKVYATSWQLQKHLIFCVQLLRDS